MKKKLIIKKLIMFSLVFFVVFACNAYAVTERVLDGVSFLGNPLGGLNSEEVNNIIEKEEKEIANQTVVIEITEKNQQFQITLEELGVHLDKDKVMQEIFSVGDSQSWWNKTWIKWVVMYQGYIVPAYYKYDKKDISSKLEELTVKWRIEARDAHFTINNKDEIRIIPETIGQDIDYDSFYNELDINLEKRHNTLLKIRVKLHEIYPDIIQNELESLNIKYIVSEFTTSFNNKLVNRTNNIYVAIKSLNCYILGPGEVFSFNDVVGPRTEEKGFKGAKIIVDNQFVNGIGGGVCQVATTLYNAVLGAGLEIVERSPHSLIIPYVKPGLDATVSYGYKDLKFRNDTGNHLLINAIADENTLSFKIYGEIKPEYRIKIKSIQEKKIEPNTVYKPDPEIVLGQYVLKRKGCPGYKYRVEKYVYDLNNELLKKETMYHDYYPPVKKVILVNPDSPLLSNSGNV